MPSCSNRSARRAPASASSRASRCSLCSTSVTSDPSPPEELRELDADGSSSEHDQARRDLARPDRLAVRPVLDLVDALERRQGGPRSGRDDELVVLELSLADGDDSGPGDARVAAHELGALVLDPPGVPRVVTAVGDLVAPPPDAFDVDLPGDRFRRAGGEPGGREHLGRSQQRLRRQARVVRALAARELALDDRDLDVGVESPERADEVLAARAGAEHDDSSVGHQTERAGFEPATHLSARTRFPVALLRPLGHLSKRRQPSDAWSASTLCTEDT